MQNSGTVMELVELLMGKEDLKRGNSGWYKDVSFRIVESHIPEMSRQVGLRQSVKRQASFF